MRCSLWSLSSLEHPRFGPAEIGFKRRIRCFLILKSRMTRPIRPLRRGPWTRKRLTMSVIQPAAHRRPVPTANRPLKLETLMRLRWLAVVGQTVTVLAVNFVLDFPLPLWPCLALIALSAAVNAGLYLRYGPGHRPSNRLASLQLAFDTLQLGGLLYLTG